MGSARVVTRTGPCPACGKRTVVVRPFLNARQRLVRTAHKLADGSWCDMKPKADR